MRHPRIIIASVGLAALAAAGGITAAAAGASSTSAPSAAQSAAATVHTAQATVGGKTETILGPVRDRFRCLSAAERIFQRV